MANIDEGDDIPTDNVAITVILKGIWPRVIEEVLLDDHGRQIPSPGPRGGNASADGLYFFMNCIRFSSREQCLDVHHGPTAKR